MAATTTKLQTALIIKYKDGVDAKGKEKIKSVRFSEVKTSAADQAIYEGEVFMSNTLVMNFLNEAGKKSAIRVSNVKEEITEAEVKAAMNVILAKNIFTTSGGDLKVKDSAEITDKNSTELSVK